MKQVTYENRITDQTVKEVAKVKEDYKPFTGTK